MLASGDKDIGIITPYHAQCQKIRTALHAVADGVKVGSVEEFQGQVSSRAFYLSFKYTDSIPFPGATCNHHINSTQQQRIRRVRSAAHSRFRGEPSPVQWFVQSMFIHDLSLNLLV